MTSEEIINKIKSSIIFTTSNRQMGGQHVGLSDPSVTCFCNEISTTITIGCNRSQFKNKELALLLMHLVIEENFK